MKFNDIVIEIRNLIDGAKAPIVFFDSDTDGITSYLQLKQTYPKVIGYPLNKDFEKQNESLEKLRKEHDLVLIFDIPVLTDDFLRGLDEKSIIWVDHHLYNSKEQIKKYKILHLNPLEFEGTLLCSASYLAYLICNRVDNLTFAVLGSISDFYLLDIIKDLYDYNKEDFFMLLNIKEDKVMELLEFISTNKHLLKSSQRDNWIRYLTYETNIIDLKNFFDFIYKLKDDEVIRAIRIVESMSVLDIKISINVAKGFLFEDYDKLKNDYNIILKRAQKQAYDDNLYIFDYVGKISFVKTICERMNYDLANTKVVGVCFKKDGKQNYNCSFRGRNFDVNKLITQALVGLSGSGGGHKYSVGMSVDKKDFEKFKENVRKSLSENKA